MEVNSIEQSSEVQASDEIALMHSQLIAFINEVQERLVEKAGYLPFKQEFKVLHWCCLQLLRYPAKAPQHLDSLDRYYIANMRRAGYSIEEIGFIVDRSTKTVHTYLQELGANK
jgi:hypothetical protein